MARRGPGLRLDLLPAAEPVTRGGLCAMTLDGAAIAHRWRLLLEFRSVRCYEDRRRHLVEDKKKKKKRRDPGPILAKAEYRFDQSLATGSLQNNGWADELSRKRWATDSNVFLLELRRVDDWL